jgi:hypothetical protein
LTVIKYTRFSQTHMKNTCYSREITVFHGRSAPEPGNIAGYAAISDALELPLPLPNTLVLISKKNRRYQKDGWKVFTPKHQPSLGSGLDS